MKIIYTFFLFLSCSLAFGQVQKELSGIVYDSLTKQPLAGAIVSINFGDQNIITNGNGEFVFYLLPDEVTISVRSLGYDIYRKNVILPLTNLEITLNPTSNNLEEVIVSSEGSETIKRPILGVSTLSIKTLNKLPTALGEVDVLRGLQVLPGVSSVGEASNGVNIRGSTTDQNLLLIDDMPIFNPTHMFGLFSSFPSESISGFDLYKGNVPVRYGGRTAAVLDVKLSNPIFNEFKSEGGISFVSEKLKFNIPIIEDKLAIVVSARACFNDFLFPKISPQLVNIKAGFFDGAFKLFYKINSKNTLSFSSYYSYDFFQTDLLNSIENINATATQYKYDTQGISLKWFHQFNPNMNFQTIFVNSNYSPKNLLPEYNSNATIKIEQKINYYQLKSSLNIYKDNHTIEFILDAARYKLNPGSIDPDGSVNISAIKTPLEYGNEIGIGAEDVIKLSKKVEFSLGLRYSMFFNNGPTSIRVYDPELPKTEESLLSETSVAKGKIAKSYGGFEPRLGFRFSINELNSIKFGFNICRQYFQIISNTTTPIPTSRWKLADENIKPQIGQLASLGYFKEWAGNVYEFSMEAYYRGTKNIIDYKPGADFLLSTTPETEILQGKNKSYGLELMISKKKGEFTGWLNYTYARTLNKVDEGPYQSQKVNFGNWYSANYDKPHTFNATVVINAGVHNSLSFNFTYSTGRPYTAPVGYIKYGEQVVPYYFNRNDVRLPDYHRLDFAWNIYNPKLRTKKFKGNWAFSVYNIYARKNPYSIFYKSTQYLIVPYKLVIFGTAIPSLSYNFTFN